jgi:membrane protein
MQFLRRPVSAVPQGRILRAAQVLVLTGRRYRDDHGGDRAAALAFATLLSLLPLLLLALAVYGAVGMGPESQKAVRDWLLGNFVPETARGLQQTLDRSLEAVQRSRRGFGTAGVLALVLTGWKLLSTLQRTFEQIWGVRDFASRMKRILAFWVAVMLAPLLVAASLVFSGLLGSLESGGLLPGGGFSAAASYLVAAASGWAAVLLVYRFCTGQRTPWRAAAVGATAAAVLWEVLKLGFAHYVKRAFVTKTLLSGMGMVPVFLLWLYLSWVAIILGAELAYVVHDYAAALRRSGADA